MKRGAKLNRRQIGVQEVESGEMGRKEVRTGSEQGRDRGREGRGRGTRPPSGYETNSDLICRVYDSVFLLSFYFFFPPCSIRILAGIRLGFGLG